MTSGLTRKYRASPSASASTSRKRRARQRVIESDLAIIDRLLLRKIQVTLNGVKQTTTALEAILFQLMQRAQAGDNRARRVFLKYQALAPQRAKAQRIFVVDSDAPQPLAGGGAEVDDG